MRRLFRIVNNGLGDVLVDGEIRLHPGDRMTIIQRNWPCMHGVGAWMVDCSTEVVRHFVEDWEKGYSITRAKECKRV